MTQHEFHYRDVGPSGLDLVRPLWERLRDHHAGLPGWAFADEVARASFDDRRRELLYKSAGGALRVELVSASPKNASPIACCVTSVTEAGAGEVDSMYVEPAWRRHGVGSELVTRALAWLDQQRAESQCVAVAFDNGPAVAFYRRLGFVPRTVRMEHRLTASSQ
jgi:GNAT superfamily N-acetyltransferase